LIASLPDWLAAVTLYADQDVVVINKPWGLAVQKGTRTTDDLDSRLIALAAITGERLRLTHRLDKDTSGCLVLARTAAAATRIGKLFMRGAVHKTYWALTAGVPEPRHGRIDVALIKAATPEGDRVRAATEAEQALAQRAITDYEVLRQWRDRWALVELRPQTGRQHQLRAHLAHLGTPIVHDGKYPSERPALAIGQGRLQLLARRIVLPGLEAKYEIDVTAAPPGHMAEAMASLGLAQEVV
jgi:23S rRNA pseudouridine955/2504/2580 synthase